MPVGLFRWKLRGKAAQFIWDTWSFVVYMLLTYTCCLSFRQIDRDHCTPNPCRNGGQCLNTPDDYYCQCSGDRWSWHGKNCTVPADAGAVKAAAAATVTTSTTIITNANTRSPPTQPSQPSSQRTTTTVTPTATARRPGTTVWRQQQPQNEEGDTGKSE